MFEFVTLAVFLLFAPIALAVIVSIPFIAFYEILKNGKLNYLSIRASFLSAVLLEVQFLVAIIIIGIIFNPGSSSGEGTYAFPILLFGAAIVGVVGYLFFYIRGIPKWCQWNTWWRLMSDSKRRTQ